MIRSLSTIVGLKRYGADNGLALAEVRAQHRRTLKAVQYKDYT